MTSCEEATWFLACAAADAAEHQASLRMLGRIAEIIKVAELAARD